MRLWKTHREMKGTHGDARWSGRDTLDCRQYPRISGRDREERSRETEKTEHDQETGEGRANAGSIGNEREGATPDWSHVREKWFLGRKETGRGRGELELERNTRKESRRLFSMDRGRVSGAGFPSPLMEQGMGASGFPSLQ